MLAWEMSPATKTFENFDFEAVPMISKAQVNALAVGDWLAKRQFAPAATGKNMTLLKRKLQR